MVDLSSYTTSAGAQDLHLARALLSWLGKMAKSLFTLLYFTFLFLFGLTIQERSVQKCHITNVTYHSHISGCYSITSHDSMMSMGE